MGLMPGSSSAPSPHMKFLQRASILSLMAPVGAYLWYWLVREDYWQPAFYAGLLAVLLLWRVPQLREMLRRSNRVAQAPVQNEKQSN